jgi:aryl-alcohol dehydrogenase-like predicted oxidoreductase
MPCKVCPTLLFGTSNIGPTPLYTHHETPAVSSIIQTFKDLGGQRLDTAALYGVTDEFGDGGSERMLRDVGATTGDFVIDTKVSGWCPRYIHGVQSKLGYVPDCHFGRQTTCPREAQSVSRA